MYGIDFHNNKDRYFTIGDNKCQKFAFLPFERQIIVNKVSPVNLELEKFKSEQSREAEISLHMTDKQGNELSSLLYDHKGEFSSDKETLGAIIGHEVDIISILKDLIHHSNRDLHTQKVPSEEKLWKLISKSFWTLV
ncbi:hypothetical protein O181_128314 [Austropuccinia psidii MF-1]|uniref:Uncharacterized protein n=1 Tax=Austropuccinia psidii MF-1 TaxID=1389203 RepID=A0A9Q3KWY7_9BASI|nr:hypothetical protein [Austropuccinia psidii MF-1]